MNFFPSAPNSRFSTPAPGTDELIHKKLIHAVVGDATPTPKQVAKLATFKSLQEEMSEKPQPYTILFPTEESVKDKGRVNFVLSRQWYILHYHRNTLLLPLGEKLLLEVVEREREAK